MDILQTKLVSTFVCLTDQCADTCCKHWSMQLDFPTLALYTEKAPELLPATQVVEDGSFIMRKNLDTGYCVKFEDGFCGIHAARGSDFLGDACHFYPRVTRLLGEGAVMTATMSCPEVARLALYEAQPLALENAEVARLPHGMKNVLPEALSPEGALAVHGAFLAATEDESADAATVFSRISSVARSIELVSQKDWPGAVTMYFKLADMRLPVPQPEESDPFNVLHALCGLVVASKKSLSPRLKETTDDMQRALGVSLDWDNARIELSDGSAQAYAQLQARWKTIAHLYDPLLKRWLAAQLSTACFPFAGLGNSLSDRVTIIGVRMATLRLALLCACGMAGESLPQDVVVRIVQSLSRFLDHLADPAFSLQIYSETGWTKEARLRALV